MSLKEQVKRWLPPALLDLVRRDPVGVRVGERYATWSQAEAAAGAPYGADYLTRFRIERALLNGPQKGSKDYVLMAAMLLGNPSLEVTDFGGSTGDHGTQLLETFPASRYTVVETAAMAQAAAGQFGKVQFSATLPASCDLFFTSGTLQYLEHPYGLATAAFKSAKHACIFVRNSFAETAMFHAQESELFSNGGGRVPPGHANGIVRYPHQTLVESALVALGEREGFILTARIPEAGPVWPGKSGAYGADLIFVRP